MPRFILIDNNSGIIWSDVIASDAVNAAQRADAIHDEPQRAYRALPAGTSTLAIGYDVYLAPDGYRMFAEQCSDPAAIAHVTDTCECVCFVECTEGPDEIEAREIAEAKARAASYPPAVAVQVAAAAVLTTFDGWGDNDADWPEPQRSNMRELRAALAALGAPACSG